MKYLQNVCPVVFKGAKVYLGVALFGKSWISNAILSSHSKRNAKKNGVIIVENIPIIRHIYNGKQVDSNKLSNR